MKRIIKKGLYLLLITIIYILNINTVNAEEIYLDENPESTSNYEVGSEVLVDIWSDDIFIDYVQKANLVVTFDTTKLQYVSMSTLNNNVKSCMTASSSGNKVYVTVNCSGPDKGFMIAQIATLTFKITDSGSANFSIDGSNVVNDENKNLDSIMTYKGYTTSLKDYIEPPKLNSIKIDGKSYTVRDTIDIGETTNSSINIVTTQTGTIKGNGTQELAFGTQELELVLTHNGKTATYIIEVTRTSEPSKEPEEIPPTVVLPEQPQEPVEGSNLLQTLTIEGYEIDFSPNKFVYEITLPLSVLELNVTATTEDPDATIKGVGIIKIDPTDKMITVTSTGVNNESKEYKIYLSNRDAAVTSNLLSKIIINDQEIEITDSLIYFAGITGTDLNIEAITDSNTATATINDYNLVDGMNIITITVTDGSADEQTYTLYLDVTIDQPITSVNQIPDNIDDNIIIILNQNSNLTLPREYLDLIKDTNYTVLVKIVNDYNGLIYSLTFDNTVISTYDIDLNITYINHILTTKVPSNVLINYYISDLLPEEKLYDNTNQELNTTINNNYLSFTTNGSNTYTLGSKVTVGTASTETEDNSLLIIIISIAGGVIITTVVIIVIKNKHRLGRVKETSPTSVLETTTTEQPEVLDTTPTNNNEIEKL